MKLIPIPFNCFSVCGSFFSGKSNPNLTLNLLKIGACPIWII